VGVECHSLQFHALDVDKSGCRVVEVRNGDSSPATVRTPR
jgi:hypothetical protein